MRCRKMIAAASAALRRLGLVTANVPIHAAPTELGRASGVGVAINMALLAELNTPKAGGVSVAAGIKKIIFTFISKVCSLVYWFACLACRALPPVWQGTRPHWVKVM